MRAWPTLLLTLLLGTALAATVPSPAAAMGNGGGGMHSHAGMHAHATVRVASRSVFPFISPFIPLTNGVVFPTSFVFHNNSVVFNKRFNRFNRFGFANQSPFFSPGFGWWDSSLPWTVPSYDQQPRIIVVNAASPQPPVAPAEPAKVTVETTPSGVQVVRGPGSRHLSRY
jgi:hypothetical protein